MKDRICKISLFSAILASIAALPVDARVTINNSARSYADAYNQVNALRYQQEYLDSMAANATTASATSNLPVAVTDEKLASEILNNTSTTTLDDLDACAMIWPNGLFRWDIPESGIRQNQTNQCVAVVSLVDANTNAVLATTTVAAGDTIKCNIDSFPESGLAADVRNGKTELPADAAPTMQDVEEVMNAEQRQNAGFKIAAGAILAGVAGNILAPKDAGDSKMFGTGKTQLIDTAIGAATGAGVMAASSYSGKVAGDTIKSTAVNAASGMIVGNMLAGASDEGGILVTRKCTLEKNIPASDEEYPSFEKNEYDCVVGKIETKGTPVNVENENKFYIMDRQGVTKECKKTNTSTGIECDTPASNIRLIDIAFKMIDGSYKKKTDMKSTDYPNAIKYNLKNQEDKNSKEYVLDDNYGELDTSFFLIGQATTTEGAPRPAYMIFKNRIPNKFGGYKSEELDTTKEPFNSEFIYVLRNSDGSVGSQITEKKDKIHFTPTSGDASDGGLIDLSNQARAKGTAVGAAAGGALGGYAGYQGAKSEITDRWTAAVREYQDSLSNFACMSGPRYLSKYNDYVDVPEMKKPEQ